MIGGGTAAALEQRACRGCPRGTGRRRRRSESFRLCSGRRAPPLPACRRSTSLTSRYVCKHWGTRVSFRLSSRALAALSPYQVANRPPRLGDRPQVCVHHWVVNRSLTWLTGYSRLTLRPQRRARLFTAFLTLGAAVTCYQKLTTSVELPTLCQTRRSLTCDPAHVAANISIAIAVGPRSR